MESKIDNFFANEIEIPAVLVKKEENGVENIKPLVEKFANVFVSKVFVHEPGEKLSASLVKDMIQLEWIKINPEFKFNSHSSVDGVIKYVIYKTRETHKDAVITSRLWHNLKINENVIKEIDTISGICNNISKSNNMNIDVKKMFSEKSGTATDTKVDLIKGIVEDIISGIENNFELPVRKVKLAFEVKDEGRVYEIKAKGKKKKKKVKVNYMTTDEFEKKEETTES